MQREFTYYYILILHIIKHTHIMIDKKLIEKARKERLESRLIGSVFIAIMGFVLMFIALYGIMDIEQSDNIAYHVLFMFGSIVTCFGIFTLPDEYK